MRLTLREAIEQVHPTMLSKARSDIEAATDAGYRPIGYRVYRGTLIMEITERDMRAIIDDWIRTRETPSGLYLCATEPGDDGIRWETLDGDDGSCPVDCWHRLRSALRWLTEPGIDIQYIHDLDRCANRVEERP